MHKGLREPHLLLAGPNPIRLMKNLSAILAEEEIGRIRSALYKEAGLLYKLGREHFDFAAAVESTSWRQKISRFYYAAYNVKRAVTLVGDGGFSTESSDHGKVDVLPARLENAATYSSQLKNLREDRNLADYSHLAREADLIMSVENVAVMVAKFCEDARTFMLNQGVGENDL